MIRILSILFLAMVCCAQPVRAATDMPFTVTVSEPVTVDTAGGTPRIAFTLGAATRYALYSSGSGSDTLSFVYTTQPGDLDLDGIALTSPIDLNGGSIRDAAGNNAVLIYTPVATPNVRIDHPSLSMKFIQDADGEYATGSATYGTLSGLLTALGGTFTRSTTATYFDSSGNLQVAGVNQPRFDHDPVTLSALGLLLQPARSNQIRNSTMVGAVAGSPGTLPTNWFTTLQDGFTVSVAATGSENGMNYIDLRIQASVGPSPTATNIQIAPDTSTAASAGQIWTSSLYVKSVSGTVPTLRLQIEERTAGGSLLSNSFTSVPPGTGALSARRHVHIRTLTDATTARVSTSLRFFYSANATYDFTIRVAAPQLEAGAFVTHPIPTSGSATSRGTDLLLIPVGSWYNATAGTFFNHIQWQTSAGTNFPMFFRVDDGTNANRWNNFYSQSATQLGVDAFTSTAGQGSFSTGSAVSGTAKVSGAQALNSANAAFNGVLGTLDTNWTPPAAVTQLNLFGSDANKWFRTVKYYPVRVPDAQLQLLSQ